MTAEREAPGGRVWVCLGCGRRARHLNFGGIDPDWTEACRRDARMFRVEQALVGPRGRVMVIAIDQDGGHESASRH
jgi:hypothetical protein